MSVASTAAGAAIVRCPKCEKAYRVPKARGSHAFDCARCGTEVTVRSRPRGRRKSAEAGHPENFTWPQVFARVGGIVAVTAAVGWLFIAGPRGPEARYHAALDGEYVAIIDLLARIENALDAEEAQPRMVARVDAVTELLAEPRPFGVPRARVAPAVWEKHGDQLNGRLDYLRRQKSRIFNMPGAGRFVSYGLSQLPQTDKQLEAALTKSPKPVRKY